MEIYIRATANISPQKTFGNVLFLDELVEYADNKLTCIEPDYKTIIDPKLIRRMSRVIKMSVAAALACLKEAEVNNPDAIITGTAYGCLEDTAVFLTNMVEQGEEPITPTAFVHSTHNTIGAQVALLLKCHAYNNTFVNGGSSFENALTDTLMMLYDNPGSNVLAGGMDELTDISYAVLSRFGLYKRQPISNLNLFNAVNKGTLVGEGSAFFLLSNTASANNMARLNGLSSFYKPADKDEINAEIASFLASQLTGINDIDLLITGINGDIKNDAIYNEQTLLKTIPTIGYKHLCGEYPTSTAFALWLAVNIIKTNIIPSVLNIGASAQSKKINKVLIYNHYQNIYHSLILISAC